MFRLLCVFQYLRLFVLPSMLSCSYCFSSSGFTYVVILAFLVPAWVSVDDVAQMALTRFVFEAEIS